MKPPELLLFVPCTVCKPHGCCCSRCRRTVVCLCFLKTWRSSSGLGNDRAKKTCTTNQERQENPRPHPSPWILSLGECRVPQRYACCRCYGNRRPCSKQAVHPPKTFFFVGQIAQSVALVLVCKTYELVMSFCFFYYLRVHTIVVSFQPVCVKQEGGDEKTTVGDIQLICIIDSFYINIYVSLPW